MRCRFYVFRGRPVVKFGPKEGLFPIGSMYGIFT